MPLDCSISHGVKKNVAINCVLYRKRELVARNWRDNSSANRHAGKSLRVGERCSQNSVLSRFGSLPPRRTFASTIIIPL